MSAQATTKCAAGEQKFYVAAQVFLFDKNAHHPREARMITTFVCGQPGDNESEEGIDRLGRLNAKDVKADRVGVAVLSIIPLKR